MPAVRRTFSFPACEIRCQGFDWKLLQEVTCFEWRSISHLPEESWLREGSGTCCQSIWNDGTLLLTERGCWKEAQGIKSVPFQNQWIFSQDTKSEEETVLLGHGRSGKPQSLVALRKVSDHHWDSCQDHLCGNDRYRASLHFDPVAQSATLLWKVFGPKKNYEIQVHYRK